MRAAVMNWWDGREPRERVLLLVLAVMASIFALILLLVLPLQSARAQADAELAKAQADLAIVSRVAPGLSAGTPGARQPFERAVLFSLSNAHDLKLTRVQPGADGSFAVWIDDAQTDRLYNLFEDLLTDYTATMDRAVVSSDANGRLSAQFTVR